MTLTYTNHLGDTVTLGAPGGHVHYGETDLFGHKWSYEHDGQRVWGMSLDAREVTLPVCELGGSLAEREGVYRTLEADAEEGARGTLSYHGWELGVIPIASSLDQWWWDDGVEERSVTLLVPRPLWTRDETVTYQIARADGTTQPGSDYPRDYPWEYARPSLAHVAVVDAGSAEWRWVVYGPAVDPWVVIEGNRHEVDVTVPSGSRLELDTRDRTIRMVSVDGDVSNCFPSRLRGAEGSGTYAFARLPGGRVELLTDNAFAFDVTVHYERSEPAWA